MNNNVSKFRFNEIIGLEDTLVLVFVNFQSLVSKQFIIV